MTNEIQDVNKIAGAIVIAGIIIALGIVLRGSGSTDTDQVAQEQAQEEIQEQEGVNIDALSEIDRNDHVRGSGDPIITIYEYSDFECPFCKQFHETMNRIIDEHGDSVRWVYRHYPIPQLHAKAFEEAVASECAAELAGPEGFWYFADRFFELTPSNDRTDLDVVFPQIAGELGINTDEFLSCIESGRHTARVEAQMQEASATGGRGTPWSIIVTSDGEVSSLPGAVPFEALEPAIERLINQ